MMNRILIGYDGSERGDDALALGRAFARAADDPHVVVAAVHEALPATDVYGTRSPREDRLREVVEQQLARAHTAWPQLPDEAFVVLRAGSPSAGLQRLAVAGDFDVIVLGASHRSALGRIWPGSATEQTLQTAPRPVAVAPPGYAGTHPEPASFGRVGVGYDGSVEARHALELAAPLAAAGSATVVLIDVVHAGPALTQAYGYGVLLESLREAVDGQLDEGRRALAARGVERVAVERPEGVPSLELIAATERLDLLVLGSRGHGPALRVLLGSSSARVVRAAACPVLVFPRSAAPEEAQDGDAVDEDVAAAAKG